MKKKEIIKIATKEFSKNGYEGTSLSVIADKAGVSKAALYYHFKNKDDIFLEVFKKALKDNNKMVESLLSKDLSLKETFKIMCKFKSVENSNDFLELDFNNYKLMFDALTKFNDLKEELDDQYINTFKLFRKKIKKAQDSGEISKDLDIDNAFLKAAYILEGAKVLSILNLKLLPENFNDDLFKKVWGCFEVKK